MQSQSPATSTTGTPFTLFFITTTGEWDDDRIRAAATAAGFTDNGHYIGLNEGEKDRLKTIMFPLHSELTGATNLLRFERGSDMAPGTIGRLVAALKSMAEDLDGVIRNRAGDVLTPEDLQAAGKAMETAEALRIEANRPPPPPVPPVPVRQPDGTMRVQGLLSFTHEVTTVRGKWLEECHFNAGAMGYFEGRREGAKMAGELLACIKAKGGHHVQTGRIIAAALGTTLKHGTYSGKSVENVSIGFINAIVAMVEGAAQHIGHAKYIKQVIADSFDSEALDAQFDLDLKKQTAAKAQATRKAKRDAKAVS